MKPLLILSISLGLLISAPLDADAKRGKAHGRDFSTALSGDNEVPPVDTIANGHIAVRAHKNRGRISYKLVVSNLREAVAAHIHCAPAGMNGPVGVTLFSVAPTTVRGILAEGPITETDPENGCGWLDVRDAIHAMEVGEAYVNVHTTTVPSGELRGQLDGRDHDDDSDSDSDSD